MVVGRLLEEAIRTWLTNTKGYSMAEEIKKCNECGDVPTVEMKGLSNSTTRKQTKILCANCDRDASSTISRDRAILYWNNINK
jgi:hypothetical protein